MQAQVNAQQRARNHTETLKMIFVTYVRVLKNAPHARILPAVLDVSCCIFLSSSFVFDLNAITMKLTCLCRLFGCY